MAKRGESRGLRRLTARILGTAVLGWAVLGGAVGAWAQEPPALAPSAAREVPQTKAQITLSFAPVVREAVPAVVNIYARKLVQTTTPLFQDPFFRQFFGDQLGVPRERLESSLGSGVIVDPSGLIVTNHHVIAGASEIQVVLADRRQFQATVVADDAQADLAVLRIQAGGALPFLRFKPYDSVAVGDLVLAIGDPFGVGQTVTSGIVSAKARSAQGLGGTRYFIQTDAAINPGNSGGALVSMDGRLVGINTAIYTRSGGSQGIGFAIPSDLVAAFVRDVESGGKMVRPWLGAASQAVTPTAASALGMARPIGALIAQVYPGGPAARAGLAAGDVVTAVDGHEIDDPAALEFRVITQPVGARLSLRYLHQGQARTTTLELAPPPESPAADATVLEGREPMAGAKVANLSPALAERIGADPFAGGVVVLAVSDGSTARRFGFQPGDRVLAVNDAKVGSVADLQAALARAGGFWRIVVARGGQTLTIQIRG